MSLKDDNFVRNVKQRSISFYSLKWEIVSGSPCMAIGRMIQTLHRI